MCEFVSECVCVGERERERESVDSCRMRGIPMTASKSDNWCRSARDDVFTRLSGTFWTL